MDDRGGVVDPFAGLKEATDEYKVYDSHHERVGRVDDLLVDDGDEVLYVGVKMGFFGTNSTLVPAEIIRVNDRRQLIEVSEPAETIKHAPHFGTSEDLTPELENHVRTYFGLEALRPSPQHEPQGPDIPQREGYAPQPAHPDDWAETVEIERVETTGRPTGEPAATGEPAREETPSDAVDREADERDDRAPGDAAVSERLSDESSLSRQTGGGVTVHRIRRS